MAKASVLIAAQQLAKNNKVNFPNESSEYRSARNALLAEEIELRRHIEHVASQRRALPKGGKMPQDFEFFSEAGPIRLSSLFGGKDTLMVYSMMYGPQRKSPCPMCTSFLGSAQECDEGCILGRFLENDDFSPSGRPNTRLRRKWAEFAALLWKWRAEGGREK